MTASLSQPAGVEKEPVQAEPGHSLVSIILATYNEAENIREMVGAIFDNLPDPLEVIVVDDNSPDLTWQIATDLHDPRLKVIRRIKARGLASAINRGIIESRGEIIGWMDADLCHPPSLLPSMLAQLQTCDIVIGSRYVPGGKDARDRSRVWSSRLVNRMAAFVLDYGIQDYDSGFILMHRHVLDAVSLNPSGYGAYFIEFIHACCRKGFKVVELPYTFTERLKGVSKSNVNIFQFGLAGFGYIIRILNSRFRKLD